MSVRQQWEINAYSMGKGGKNLSWIQLKNQIKSDLCSEKDNGFCSPTLHFLSEYHVLPRPRHQCQVGISELISWSINPIFPMKSFVFEFH